MASDQPASKVAVCPLGFGSTRIPAKQSSRDALIPFTCNHCKCLLFKPVRLPCNHTYCESCLPHVRECYKCGADIVLDSAKRDTGLEDQVNVFINAHAGMHIMASEYSELYESLKGVTCDQTDLTESDRRRLFLLSQGIKMCRAGNYEGAIARLEIIVRETMEDDYVLAISLAKMCDAEAEAGDHENASQHTVMSVELFEKLLKGNKTVTGNDVAIAYGKAGDVMMRCGKHEEAKMYYVKLAELRKQESLEMKESEDKLVAYAAALTKLASLEPEGPYRAQALKIIEGLSHNSSQQLRFIRLTLDTIKDQNLLRESS